MKVCPSCGSLSVTTSKGVDACGRCPKTGRFKHLHDQIGSPHPDYRHGTGAPGGSYKPMRRTDPQS